MEELLFFNHPFQVLNLKNLISCSPKNLMQPSKLSHHGPGPSRCFLRELDCTFRCTTSRKKKHDVHVRGRGVEARIGDGFPVHIAEHHVISRKMIWHEHHFQHSRPSNCLGWIFVWFFRGGLYEENASILGSQYLQRCNNPSNSYALFHMLHTTSTHFA